MCDHINNMIKDTSYSSVLLTDLFKRLGKRPVERACRPVERRNDLFKRLRKNCFFNKPWAHSPTILFTSFGY